MTDTEKVISLLQQCLDEWQYAAVRVNHIMHCIQDAVEPLKEQEPKHTQWVYEPDRTNHWHCSGCGYVTGLSGLMGNFCPNCGAKVQKKTEAELRKEVSVGYGCRY